MSSPAADEFNYDEAKVPAYVLPSVLKCGDGSTVSAPADWTGKRRPELVRLFTEQVYGEAPARPALAFTVRENAVPALDGQALRTQVHVSFTGKADGPGMEVLMYVPARAKGPVPAFLGLNFKGNQSIHTDPGIRMCETWLGAVKDGTVENNKATEKSRGCQASRWQVEKALAAGCATVTICYSDIDPDTDDGFRNGVHALFPDIEARRGGTTWGSIAAWAWGLSLAMDWLEQEPRVNAERVILHGHSRLGKTALWAGALDPRFAAVISNESGCGGAALSRRAFGETVKRINTSFPHWFCRNFRQYNDNEGALPVDQHELVALIAPRPVLVCSAAGDRWSDPHGEFLAVWHAAPVYQLLGRTAVKRLDWPGSQTGYDASYFIREGPHDVTEEDWTAWLGLLQRLEK